MQAIYLIAAAAKGDISKVKKFLDKGANVNVRDDHGVTALMVASAYNHKDVVKLLLDRGADVNAKTIEGATALLLASEKGNTDVVKILLDKGADLNIRDADGRTALDYATINNHKEIIKLLNIEGKFDSDVGKSESKHKTFLEKILPYVFILGIVGFSVGAGYKIYLEDGSLASAIFFWYFGTLYVNNFLASYRSIWTRLRFDCTIFCIALIRGERRVH